MTSALAGRRIGLLTASASRLGGGVFEAVVAQAALLQGLGAEPSVHALDDACAAEDRARFGGVAVHHAPVLGPRQVGFAPGLLAQLRAARLDCLHLHGIWMYPSHAATRWARETGRAYLVSPHGMLDPWITERGRWKKTLARAGYERASWRRATRLHALTLAEARDIAAESDRGDSVVVPNAAPPALADPPADRPPLVAAIGRIHPKKNFAALVGGWRLARRPAGARLVIAGWGDPVDVAALEQVIGDGAGGVEFVGPVHGAAKAELLAQARGVALPSLSEGLPMAVLEAWAAGAPVLMSAHCHLPEGFAAGAALDCGIEPASVASAIEALFALDPAGWRAMQHAALDLVRGPFSAATIARQWTAIYAEAIATAEARR